MIIYRIGNYWCLEVAGYIWDRDKSLELMKSLYPSAKVIEWSRDVA